MTGAPPTAMVSGGTVLCTIAARVPPAGLEAFAGQARDLIDLARRFGARSLGVYSDVPPADGLFEAGGEPGDRTCAILLAFANRLTFDEFSDSLQAMALGPSWPLEIEVMDSLPGFGAPASADPPVPYHILKYH